MAQKRKIMSTVEWIILFLGLGILVYVGLQSKGCDLLKRTEEMEIIERPHDPE